MKRLSVILLLAVFALTGCSPGFMAAVHEVMEPYLSSPSASPSESALPEPEQDADFPGAYTVPDGWVKAEQYSTKSKIFYVEEGHEEDELPDNISIEVGTNRYSLDEHEQFRDAILQQLYMQVSGQDAQVFGSGSYTEQDYILYTFTISWEDVLSKQYYIVDDKRYCLIHLTVYSGSESAEDAAQSMADSFVWN